MSKKLERIFYFGMMLSMSLFLCSCFGNSKEREYANLTKIENFFSVKTAHYSYYYIINGEISVWSRRFHDDIQYIAQTLNDNHPTEISYEVYKKVANKEVEGPSPRYIKVENDIDKISEFVLSDDHGLIRIEISNNEKLNRESYSRFYLVDLKVSKQILDFALSKAEEENPVISEELSLI